jgi:hypothetical protein
MNSPPPNRKRTKYRSSVIVVSTRLQHTCIKYVHIQIYGDNLQTEEEASYNVEEETVMGPVDYLMVRFPGNKFNGKIIPELTDLEKRGIIRIIDLVLVIKDANGKLFVTKAEDLRGDEGRAFEKLAKNTQEWFYEGDIAAISEGLPNDSSAALLLYENVWAVKFKKALLESDAELIDMGRIPQEAIEKAQKLMAKEGTR